MIISLLTKFSLIFFHFQSFAEKIGSLMQRPNEDLVDKDEVPTWMKYAGRGLGTVGGGCKYQNF